MKKMRLKNSEKVRETRTFRRPYKQTLAECAFLRGRPLIPIDCRHPGRRDDAVRQIGEHACGAVDVHAVMNIGRVHDNQRINLWCHVAGSATTVIIMTRPHSAQSEIGNPDIPSPLVRGEQQDVLGFDVVMLNRGIEQELHPFYELREPIGHGHCIMTMHVGIMEITGGSGE